MSEQKDADKQLQQQTNQMFNIAERDVMNYVADFLDEVPSVVFKDEVPTIVEPFILLPLDDYKKRICLKFHMVSLDSNGHPIHTSDQTILDTAVPIVNLLKYEKVKEGLGFLFYCAKNVYASIAHSSLIDNKAITNTQLEFNQDEPNGYPNWSFQPKFYHEVSLKIKFLEETLGRVVYIKQHTSEFPKNIVDDAHVEYVNIVNTLIATKKDNTAEIQAVEKKINDEFSKRAYLGIFITELSVDDLPKPIMSEKEDIGIQNNNMPKISGSLYEDTDNAVELSTVETDLKNICL